MGERILNFKELRVYQMAFELQQDIFEVSKQFPKEERYALTDQIRRASRSVGANISEAWQKRRYVAHFVSKLTDADGEQAETQHWVDTAMACHYISEEQQESMLEKCSRIGQMLGTMIANPKSSARNEAYESAVFSPPICVNDNWRSALGLLSSVLGPLTYVRHRWPV